MERVHPSEHEVPKEIWTEADIENFLIQIASSRQVKIEEDGPDVLRLVSLGRLQKFKRWLELDSRFFKANRYAIYRESPLFSQLPSRRIEFGPRWKSEIETILSQTDTGRNEIAIFVVYNPQTKAFEFRKGPTGHRGRLNLTKSIVRTEVVDRTPIVVFGHTHPLPQTLDKRTAHHYRYPTNTAFFSPGDLNNIVDALITPFQFVISGDHMSVGITTRETIREDIGEEFFKTRVGIPKDAFERKKIRDDLRATYYLLKALHSQPPKNFDMFEWNVEVAKKYRFALYRGNMEAVERVV